MSGAVVFASDVVLGIVSEHHLPEGESALTVVPVSAIKQEADAASWWTLLGVDPQQLVRLPDETARRPAYWATIGELVRGILLGRETELVACQL